MTRFDKKLFDYHGGYLTYMGNFVARFRGRGKPNKADYVRILSNNYDVEDYFTRLKDSAPMQILMDDGFVEIDLENRRIIVRYDREMVPVKDLKVVSF